MKIEADYEQIRRRHPEFPTYTGEFYAHKQPSALVHIGESTAM